jgi:SpoVK/Ycf46/Vps4 family AAA+-type ATPase
MPDYRKCWRQDLSNLPPQRLRLARLALNFHRASVDDKARLSMHRSPKALQRLIGPLVDPGFKAWFEGELEDKPEDELTMLLDDSEDTDREQWRRLLSMVPDDLVERVRETDRQDPLTEVAELLCNLLDLDDVERRLVLFVDLLSVSGALRRLCREGSNERPQVNIERLALMLELSTDAISRALRPESKLRRLALLKPSDHSDLEDFLKPGEVLKQTIANRPRSESELLAVFVEPLSEAQAGLDSFPHLERHAALLKQVLGRAAELGESGVNALFYGAPGTGKTELAKAIAAALGVAAYSVRTTNSEGEPLGREGRLGGYQMAQLLLQGARSPLLIFDEMEDLQSTDELMLAGLTGYAPSRDKGWLNRVLESNQVPTIWITNHLHSLDPAVRRRFLLPVEFRTPPRHVRRGIAARMLADTGVSEAMLDEIVSDVTTTPAALANVRRLLSLNPIDDVDSLIRQTLADLRKAMHGSSTPRIRRPNTTIDLGLLNIDGAQSPETVIEGIAKSGQGRLCLYGKPGTGKTQFAELLAESLDRELIVASASQVLSPYVGETEQNLADLFERDDPDHSVLLLDEVDSFLSDRGNAERNWERTQVNELLQQMERFPGVFIAATNLMDGLDPAALRRFDLKLMFNPMTTKQRYRAFAQEVLGDADTEVPETARRILDKLEGLTLGDIANVCRQQRVLGESLAPEHFLHRLRREWELKGRAA